jgi:hypothetical protein
MPQYTTNVRDGSKAESLRNGRMSAFASSSGHTSAPAFSSFVPQPDWCIAPELYAIPLPGATEYRQRNYGSERLEQASSGLS